MEDNNQFSEENVKNTMNIILNAGDARDFISKALDDVANSNYDNAKENMKKANEKLVKAHRLQTKKIQEEAEGKPIQYSVLFTHAQDTLMTINTEYNLANHLIKIFEKRDCQCKGDLNEKK
ncbi:PTS lactose/cellobiose transporter subunit IIA [Lactobacillus huangpiensis]|uniref:PTS lactose/cellobiose transporter subunit IIA n=1 Tax=Lactobacillus TaxID=1578 RepID=UPI0005142B14|nr:PTS lactose/cellobiose transporter subunit IIA [Lactobacillus huangpiensis]KGG55187.1 PTS system, cellobiose-specific IIA component [Lactobacillus sp. wkB10]